MNWWCCCWTLAQKYFWDLVRSLWLRCGSTNCVQANKTLNAACESILDQPTGVLGPQLTPDIWPCWNCRALFNLPNFRTEQRLLWAVKHQHKLQTFGRHQMELLAWFWMSPHVLLVPNWRTALIVMTAIWCGILGNLQNGTPPSVLVETPPQDSTNLKVPRGVWEQLWSSSEALVAVVINKEMPPKCAQQHWHTQPVLESQQITTSKSNDKTNYTTESAGSKLAGYYVFTLIGALWLLTWCHERGVCVLVLLWL